MTDTQFFPPRPPATPTIYAFASTHPDHAGLLKVGYTERVAADRIAEQFPSGVNPYRIELIEPAMRSDGSGFTDHDIHRHLRARGIKNTSHEWFKCTVAQVLAAIVAVRERTANVEDRTMSFGLRPEQREAVEMTADYFEKARTEQPGHTPHFLWNAKLRFGKTFAAYQLAKKMGWKKVLVLTFKPAVVHAWSEDLQRHIDFEGWKFVAPGGELAWTDVDDDRPIVCFGSFQDYLGRTKSGGIKAKNEWVHDIEWDCVMLDEYHYGAWRENAKGLFGADEEDAGEVAGEVTADEEAFDEAILPITTAHYLYLSGTPFRALASGEFIEEQIYNWTYSDEQRAKRDWKGPGPNPYAALPRLVLMTYTLPDDIRQVAEQGEFNEFDLNEFFLAEGEGDDAKFEHADEVQKWLDLIRGAYRGTTIDDLKLGKDRPPLPFSDVRLLGVLQHSFWFLPSVASCYAMANLLKAKNNNADLETIINRSEQIKDAKRRAGEGEEPSGKEKKELTEAEKERKSLRKQVQEKLIKFAARVPVFMYLTDFREQRLKDVITKVEPKLFKKVTGLTTADFERLVSLGIFNSALMNDAVWKFRRYEDASLRYMGVSRHEGMDVGLFDTALTEEDFKATFEGLAEG